MSDNNNYSDHTNGDNYGSSLNDNTMAYITNTHPTDHTENSPNNTDDDDFDTRHLRAAGCSCNFKQLLSAETPEEFHNHLSQLQRMPNTGTLTKGIMVEIYVNLRQHVVDRLLYDFLATIAPLDALPLFEQQTPRQMCGKLKLFVKQMRKKHMSRRKPSCRAFFAEPYDFKINEKMRHAVIEGQQRGREMAEERARARDPEVLTKRLEEAREELRDAERVKAELTARLEVVEAERNEVKIEVDRLKKDNLEIHLSLSCT